KTAESIGGGRMGAVSASPRKSWVIERGQAALRASAGTNTEAAQCEADRCDPRSRSVALWSCICLAFATFRNSVRSYRARVGRFQHVLPGWNSREVETAGIHLRLSDSPDRHLHQ